MKIDLTLCPFYLELCTSWHFHHIMLKMRKFWGTKRIKIYLYLLHNQQRTMRDSWRITSCQMSLPQTTANYPSSLLVAMNYKYNNRRMY